VPAREARLTAQPCWGSAEASAAGASAGAGSRSVLLSRMYVCLVTSGASSTGISSCGPEGVVDAEVTASGHASTRSEASAACTLAVHTLGFEKGWIGSEGKDARFPRPLDPNFFYLICGLSQAGRVSD
jgi:hypothetical protein